MSIKQVSGSDVDERLAALLTNVNAVRAIAGAVEGTLGPKGLDTMLVDRFGEVVITNDGITILTKMDVNHPAAKMVINTAKAQEEEVGDGTTTATIMAGTLLSEGVNQVLRGVPVTRVIEGIRRAIDCAISSIKAKSRDINGVDDPLLMQVALIAGREHKDIAELVTQAARLVGEEKLRDPTFKLQETVVAEEGAENEVFMGLIISKQRLNNQMPKKVSPAKVLILDDALEPETVEEEALATETGFTRHLELREQFKSNIEQLINMGVKFIACDGGVDPIAEEMLTDAEVMVVSRVSSQELRKACEHTGSRAVKRTALKKPAAELEKYLGFADMVYEDERLEHIRIVGGKGKPMATILVGAATEEVVDERERIAQDAAAAVQAAIKGGVVPGGGAVEIAVVKDVMKLRDSVSGMAAYGIDCVIEALKRPLAQIVANAGFNPLEKVGDVLAAQSSDGVFSLGINCDTGEIVDMMEAGVVDPALVKIYALKAAGEIAEAILRINTIIKKRDEGAVMESGGLQQPQPPQLDEMEF